MDKKQRVSKRIDEIGIGAAASGLLWASMTACALAFFMAPHEYYITDLSVNIYASVWLLLFACFEGCLAAVISRDKDASCRAAAFVTAWACIAAAFLVAAWCANAALAACT